MTDQTIMFKEILKKKALEEKKINTIINGDVSHNNVKRDTKGNLIEKNELLHEAYLIYKLTQQHLNILTKNRALYLNIERHLNYDSHLTEKDLDDLDQQSNTFIKNCNERIDNLQQHIILKFPEIEPRLESHWESIIAYLRTYLASASKVQKELQESRMNLLFKNQLSNASKGLNSSTIIQDEIIESYNEEEDTAQFTTMEKLQFEKENQKLLEELNGTLQEVNQIEKGLLEISNLQNQLEMHISTQNQEIERLYDESIQTTDNLMKGNSYLNKATSYGVQFRNFMLLFFIIMSLVLLFLHWYD